MSVYNRRLPFYLLLDTSESLAGEPIEAVAQGVAALLSDLRTDPMALETVHLSVITFASSAAVATPLTELMKFQPPKLTLGSGTALGAALKLLVKCLDTEVVKGSATQKGDWKPVVMIVTDGAPTDDWKAIADTVRTAVHGKRANVVAVGVGADADTEQLARITPTVLKGTDLQPGTLRALFKWVSASVSNASARMDGGVALPPLPAGAVEVATHGASPVSDRQLFLHARCVGSKQFYIMRYQKSGRNYEAVGAHQVDQFDFGPKGQAAPNIPVDRLEAPPPCPYCKNPTISFCECGKLFCSPIIKRPMTLACPWCAKKADYAPSGGFDIKTGLG